MRVRVKARAAMVKAGATSFARPWYKKDSNKTETGRSKRFIQGKGRLSYTKKKNACSWDFNTEPTRDTCTLPLQDHRDYRNARRAETHTHPSL
jgi:hypothetical protein